MKIRREMTVLITGASGGLGHHMCHALAEFGLNMALVAFPGIELESLSRELIKKGVNARSWVYDLGDAEQCRASFEKVVEHFGRIDLLINNAGVEFTAAYDDLTDRTINEIVAVNLLAPMALTRMVLPGMLERKCGHIVNVSSLAGKSGPGFQEPYAASKAGLIGFTASLRATYRGTGVSASVICPGFVEAGIYSRLKEETGLSAPALLGTSRPEKVVTGLIRAIQRDLPEVIINPYPVRPLFAVTALFPRLGEFIVRTIGAHEFFRKIAAVHRQKGASGPRSNLKEFRSQK